MLVGKKLKVLKKPNPEKEAELREQINENGGLEKKDIPAMIFSAFLVFMPVALIVLALFVVLALLFLA